MTKSLLALLFILIISIGISESYAQSITIETNKEFFTAGDSIEISGIVPDGQQGELVAIEVRSPSDETTLIRTVQLGPGGSFNLEFKIPSSAESGDYEVIANAQISGESITQTKKISLSSQSSTSPTPNQGGGCLIATATYGSELSPQVQQLRELRDNTLLQTNSGSAFMSAFNQFYYSFSPTIADWERQNQVFKEAVKLAITPLIKSLSILNYVNMDSEAEVLGYGISLILLNLGMYFVAPFGIVWALVRKNW